MDTILYLVPNPELVGSARTYKLRFPNTDPSDINGRRIKKQVWKITNIPEDDQILIINGTPIEDNSNGVDMKLTSGSRLYLEGRKKSAIDKMETKKVLDNDSMSLPPPLNPPFLHQTQSVIQPLISKYSALVQNKVESLEKPLATVSSLPMPTSVPQTALSTTAAEILRSVSPSPMAVRVNNDTVVTPLEAPRTSSPAQIERPLHVTPLSAPAHPQPIINAKTTMSPRTPRLPVEGTASIEVLDFEHQQRMKLREQHEAIRQARELEFLRTQEELEATRMKHAVEVAQLEHQKKENENNIQSTLQAHQQISQTIHRLTNQRQHEREMEDVEARELDRQIEELTAQKELMRLREMENLRSKIRQQTQIHNDILKEKMQIEIAKKATHLGANSKAYHLQRQEEDIRMRELALEREWAEIESRRVLLETMNDGTPRRPTIPGKMEAPHWSVKSTIRENSNSNNYERSESHGPPERDKNSSIHTYTDKTPSTTNTVTETSISSIHPNTQYDYVHQPTTPHRNAQSYPPYNTNTHPTQSPNPTTLRQARTLQFNTPSRPSTQVQTPVPLPLSRAASAPHRMPINLNDTPPGTPTRSKTPPPGTPPRQPQPQHITKPSIPINLSNGNVSRTTTSANSGEGPTVVYQHESKKTYTKPSEILSQSTTTRSVVAPTHTTSTTHITSVQSRSKPPPSVAASMNSLGSASGSSQSKVTDIETLSRLVAPRSSATQSLTTTSSRRNSSPSSGPSTSRQTPQPLPISHLPSPNPRSSPGRSTTPNALPTTTPTSHRTVGSSTFNPSLSPSTTRTYSSELTKSDAQNNYSPPPSPTPRPRSTSSSVTNSLYHRVSMRGRSSTPNSPTPSNQTSLPPSPLKPLNVIMAQSQPNEASIQSSKISTKISDKENINPRAYSPKPTNFNDSNTKTSNRSSPSIIQKQKKRLGSRSPMETATSYASSQTVLSESNSVRIPSISLPPRSTSPDTTPTASILPPSFPPDTSHPAEGSYTILKDEEAINRANAMLRELALSIDLDEDSLEFDSNSTCVVGIEDKYSLLITFDSATQRVYVYSTLLNTLPQNKAIRLQLFEYLLDSALFGRNMAGGGVGISVKNDFVLLASSLLLSISKPSALPALINVFVECLNHWKDQLHNFISQLEHEPQRDESLGIRLTTHHSDDGSPDGVILLAVNEGSVGSTSGLRKGDIIREVSGNIVRGLLDWTWSPHDNGGFKVVVSRQGQNIPLQIRVPITVPNPSPNTGYMTPHQYSRSPRTYS